MRVTQVRVPIRRETRIAAPDPCPDFDDLRRSVPSPRAPGIQRLTGRRLTQVRVPLPGPRIPPGKAIGNCDEAGFTEIELHLRQIMRYYVGTDLPFGVTSGDKLVETISTGNMIGERAQTSGDIVEPDSGLFPYREQRSLFTWKLTGTDFTDVPLNVTGRIYAQPWINRGPAVPPDETLDTYPDFTVSYELWTTTWDFEGLDPNSSGGWVPNGDLIASGDLVVPSQGYPDPASFVVSSDPIDVDVSFTGHFFQLVLISVATYGITEWVHTDSGHFQYETLHYDFIEGDNGRPGFGPSYHFDQWIGAFSTVEFADEGDRDVEPAVIVEP